MASRLIEKYMRGAYLPHIWCAGCGNGIILRDVVQAVENLGIERRDTIIVSGIGCSSRAVGYLDFDTLHTTQYRLMMARPIFAHNAHRRYCQHRTLWQHRPGF